VNICCRRSRNFWLRFAIWGNEHLQNLRGRSTVAIDDHVAGRIRERRIMLGLTQQQLAEMISATARSFLNFG
jgi:DNA-binding XRE family transcriptional regulator